MDIMEALLLFFFWLAKIPVAGHLIVVFTEYITCLDSVQTNILTVYAYIVLVIITNKYWINREDHAVNE